MSRRSQIRRSRYSLPQRCHNLDKGELTPVIGETNAACVILELST